MADNKLTREVLKKENFDEIQNALAADATLFAEEVANKSVEELKEMEAALMEEFKENDEHLSKVTYSLADKVEYDGHTFKRSEIINAIIGFINKMEVQFQASLGIYQGIRYWKTKGADPVPYAIFDNTIRLLGTLKFKGEKECLDILVINNWFATAHEAYKRDNIWTNYLAAKHESILQAYKKYEEGEAEATADAQV